MKEDEQIIKNFGYTKFADNDEIDEDELEEKEPGIFEGDPNADREEYKQRLLDRFYGNWQFNL